MTEEEIQQKIKDTVDQKLKDNGRNSHRYNEIIANLISELVKVRSLSK